MRKLLIPLLMAGVMLPSAAYSDRDDRGPRELRERSENSDDRSNDRPQRAERLNSDAPRIRVDQVERPARIERSFETQSGEPTRVRRERSRDVQAVEQVKQVGRIKRGNDDDVGAITRTGRQEAVRTQDGVQASRDRDGFNGLHDRIVRKGDRVDNHRSWSRDWRQDSRYNWYGYRSRYGSLFRLRRYHDPYGWNYRRFSIGYSLWPSYYGSSFWLNDPWHYRLPPAYGPYRWVRYYGDAMLVNIYTGQVVDVIYNVFW